jgi:hypothetical protein
MSDRSQLMLFELPAGALTRSSAASCVPTSASPGRARGSASGRAAGLRGARCSASSGDSDPFFSSLKTCLASELSALTGCSLDWKESATPAGRSWSVLSTSVRPIDGIGCGSSENWHTIHGTANEANLRKQGPSGCELGRQVIAASSPADAGGAPTSWPTPASRDWKADEHAPAAQARNSPCLPAAVALAGPAAPASPSTPGKPRGSLNPAWVTQLQGAPDGWLDLGDATLCELWETATRRPARK